MFDNIKKNFREVYWLFWKILQRWDLADSAVNLENDLLLRTCYFVSECSSHSKPGFSLMTGFLSHPTPNLTQF